MSLICNVYSNGNKNAICVNTGEVKISKKHLSTSFVHTCSVLAFTVNDLNFLAHVDAFVPNMKEKMLVELKNLNVKNIKKVHIWKGSNCFEDCPSYEIVKEILKEIGINNIKYHKVNDVGLVFPL